MAKWHEAKQDLVNAIKRLHEIAEYIANDEDAELKKMKSEVYLLLADCVERGGTMTSSDNLETIYKQAVSCDVNSSEPCVQLGHYMNRRLEILDEQLASQVVELDPSLPSNVLEMLLI
jgi:hypothetical protein